MQSEKIKSISFRLKMVVGVFFTIFMWVVGIAVYSIVCGIISGVYAVVTGALFDNTFVVPRSIWFSLFFIFSPLIVLVGYMLWSRGRYGFGEDCPLRIKLAYTLVWFLPTLAWGVSVFLRLIDLAALSSILYEWRYAILPFGLIAIPLYEIYRIAQRINRRQEEVSHGDITV